jgi:dynein heavy chain
MRNVISSSFETVTTVSVGVELLETFIHLSKRETIRRTIDKKTAELYALFVNVSKRNIGLCIILS